jgi:hypothetical protein
VVRDRGRVAKGRGGKAALVQRSPSPCGRGAAGAAAAAAARAPGDRRAIWRAATPVPTGQGTAKGDAAPERPRGGWPGGGGGGGKMPAMWGGGTGGGGGGGGGGGDGARAASGAAAGAPSAPPGASEGGGDIGGPSAGGGGPRAAAAGARESGCWLGLRTRGRAAHRRSHALCGQRRRPRAPPRGGERGRETVDDGSQRGGGAHGASPPFFSPHSRGGGETRMTPSPRTNRNGSDRLLV